MGGKFGLVGVSGSGKTTAFQLLAGLKRPSDGSAVLYGKDTYSLWNIGWCSERNALFGPLTCRQNLMIIAGLIGMIDLTKQEIVP
ncbi:hypothetical protein COOONC_07152 [Cooperia oncophora]